MPYLKVSGARCGVLVGTSEKESQHDIGGLPTYNASMKLSYHESGQVHVKTQDTDARPLALVQATPIARLSGQHMFTLELEGIDHFAAAKPAELLKESTVGIALPHAAWRARIAGFGGYNFRDICGKMGRPIATSRHRSTHPLPPPSITLSFVRPGLPAPLLLGLYILTTGSLQTEQEPKPMEMLVAGFEPNKAGGQSAVFISASA
jgi:hypothetical protein